MFQKFKTLVDSLHGDIAEVGVYQGSSALELARTWPNKQIHLFDTFCGMPRSDPEIDTHKEGDFASTSLKQVMELLKEFKNIHYYPGVFPESIPPYMHRWFAFVNIDVDLYRSTQDCLAYFWLWLAKGGILFVQNDYNFCKCKGVTKAVDEFNRSRGLRLNKNGSEVWVIK